MTLDILFTYLTVDERNGGWGGEAPRVLWGGGGGGILISKKCIEANTFFFCLCSLKSDEYQRCRRGDISETDTISPSEGE